MKEIIASENKTAVSRIAFDEETKELLFNKLLEELNEFKSTPNAEEMADILEVIKTISSVYHLNMEEVLFIKTAKKESRGGFDKRSFRKSYRKRIG